jgi:hypothetical protein
VTRGREIEDAAVAAALAEFSAAWSDGVEMDPEEARQRALAAGQPEVVNDLAGGVGRVGGVGGPGPGLAAEAAGVQGESPIVIDFADFGMALPTGMAAPAPQMAQDALGEGVGTWRPFDQDAWLKAEMAALVEGMVRCWSRRRWRGVLTEFEVLEVEQEGEWILGEVESGDDCPNCGGDGVISSDERDYTGDYVENDCFVCHGTGKHADELHFLSRHDALLLERSTGYLYLQSFKTTGSWDRRKELDAQVDMQGLSEAVDVEKRFAEAWELLQEVKTIESAAVLDSMAAAGQVHTKVLGKMAEVDALVSPRVAQWLATLPDPPTILGVRYEYLLKGSRREDKKALPGSARWNQESILCRAYAQEGITSDDRRWAWTYEWKDESGKGRRLDYKSWHKQAVWASMPIAEWIDLLDQGKVQEGALDDDGNAMDALDAQLVPVLVAYRNRDDALDWLEQTEAQEVRIAQDVEAVRQAEREGGYGAKRSALNRLFPMTRGACSYPGVCSFRSMPTSPGFCFGPPDPEHDSMVLDNFRPRTPNHPKEDVLAQIKEK